jgi:hypothetical protein
MHKPLPAYASVQQRAFVYVLGFPQTRRVPWAVYSALAGPDTRTPVACTPRSRLW